MYDVSPVNWIAGRFGSRKSLPLERPSQKFRSRHAISAAAYRSTAHILSPTVHAHKGTVVVCLPHLIEMSGWAAQQNKRRKHLSKEPRKNKATPSSVP
ncbi:hypothetical protein BRADI_1g26524v3 [Brachypodium distachyon]|uniref:Uncharacterized protein n=1 Tax=Brachypodium distachyon TaxID=15368 RepID=A0A2K2DL76_BRADI|nr:hypothetical protein BRADI_1g26524v3 [Brachypodium distachyon]